MKRLLQWFRELLNRAWKKLKLSRFFLAIIMLSIGISGTICFYEGRELKTEYDQSMKIWEEHLVNKANAAKRSGEEVSANSQAAENGGQETALSIEELQDYIWLHESTRGKNNYSKCEIVGKINGIGYGIWDNNYVCFDNHAEEMETLNKWIIEKREKGMSDTELLCLYSGNNYAQCK